MLKGTEVVEKVQVWVINTQLNTVFVRQLEMGESELKGVGPRNTGDGVEEGMWMAGILSLLVRSEELDNGEREEISELTVVLPVWQEVVQNDNMDKLGYVLWDVFKSMIAKGMIVKKV